MVRCDTDEEFTRGPCCAHAIAAAAPCVERCVLHMWHWSVVCLCVSVGHCQSEHMVLSCRVKCLHAISNIILLLLQVWN